MRLIVFLASLFWVDLLGMGAIVQVEDVFPQNGAESSIVLVDR
jgi:hypothetical protein